MSIGRRLAIVLGALVGLVSMSVGTTPVGNAIAGIVGAGITFLLVDAWAAAYEHRRKERRSEHPTEPRE